MIEWEKKQNVARKARKGVQPLMKKQHALQKCLFTASMFFLIYIYLIRNVTYHTIFKKMRNEEAYAVIFVFNPLSL